MSKPATKITEYDFHDIANIYPLAKEDEFTLLKESIKERGQKSPIVLFDKKIIDGRNRYIACQELGIEPIVEVFSGTYEEALKYAIELNSGRRHMDKSQRAMMAANHVIKSRSGAGKKVPVSVAAEMFLVSIKYINTSISLINKYETMANEVLAGELTLAQAENKRYEIENYEREIDLLKSGTEDFQDFSSIGESRRYTELQSLNADELRKRLLACEKSKKFSH